MSEALRADPCRRLAERLRRELATGWPVDPETARWVEATVGRLPAERLQALLADEDHPERGPLLARLFTPDESLQVALEPLIESAGFTAAHAQQVLAHLLTPPLPAVLRLPAGGGRVRLVLPAEGAAHLVGQLRIAKRLPDLLRRRIDELADRRTAVRLKVRVRNATGSFGDPAVDFLCGCVAGLDFGRASDYECFDHALSLAADLPAGADVFEELVRRRRTWERQLRAAQRHQAQLRRHNPETLMLLGERLGAADPAVARRQLAVIDRLCRAAFGRTPPPAPPITEARLRAAADETAAGRPESRRRQREDP